MPHDLNDVVVVVVIPVERQFVVYPQADQHRDHHADRQATDINE